MKRPVIALTTDSNDSDDRYMSTMTYAAAIDGVNCRSRWGSRRVDRIGKSSVTRNLQRMNTRRRGRIGHCRYDGRTRGADGGDRRSIHHDLRAIPEAGAPGDDWLTRR